MKHNLIKRLFVTLSLIATNSFAQDDGPSVNNLKNNIKAVNEEMSRQEMMNYLFMLVGFVLVLAVAWFSTNVAKKRRLERDAFLRNHHAQNLNLKHNMHDPYFKSQAAKARK